MPDPLEFQIPGDNRLFIVLRVVTSRDHVPFAPLDDIPLDPVRSPGWKPDEEMARCTHHWFDSQY